ncbi:MAG: hypothetical protein LBI18_01645 [Planctomycetaceae bacterium]|nr:hypothetical protein [Planctomycetaceae bacterium]
MFLGNMELVVAGSNWRTAGKEIPNRSPTQIAAHKAETVILPQKRAIFFRLTAR